MTKTLLIIIGIAGAMIIATGIMWYNDPVNTLRRQLYDENQWIYWNAMYKIGRHGDRAPTKLLQDKDMGFRVYALVVLCRLDDKESISKVTKLLQDKDREVRLYALVILGRLGAKEAIPEIKKVLNDNEGFVRKAAEKALKKLGVPDEEIQKAKEK